MKKFIYFLFLLVVCLSANAQQRPLQSLYMFDPLLVNPAYAGSQVQLSATAIYRNQWVNLDGAPKTYTQTIHSGFRKYRVGLGIILSNDQIGIHNDVGFYGVYSYKIPINKKKGTLSFGLQGGFNNLRSNYALLDPKDPNNVTTGSFIANRFNPNIGAGIYFRQNTFYAGISVPYMLNNKVVGLENFGNIARQHRYYYIMGGFTKSLSNIVKLVPSTLIKYQEDAPLTFDINAFLVFYNAVGLGCSYRFNDSVIPMFELQLNDNFHVGYAYDMTTSALNQYSNGSHEIMINYRVKIAKIHKGLECPSYW